MKQITVIDQNGNSVPEEIKAEIIKQPIFFSDTDSRHWFFDFKLPDGRWCESLEINNELTAEIYTDEELRNGVAYAHQCCDKDGRFEHFGTCTYPIRYKVTEQQIAEAKKELERAKAEIFEKHGNDLLFVGMGSEYPEEYPGDICNHRIRTEFKNRHGRRFFIELVRGGHINSDTLLSGTPQRYPTFSP